MPKLTRTTALHFREELRSAREAVLRDAEQFVEVIHAIERLGSFLDPVEGEPKKTPGLSSYKPRIARLVESSPLADGRPPWLPDFGSIYESVREARNDAIHQGAFARHLAANTVKLAIVLEGALLAAAHLGDPTVDTIDAYMVKNPDCSCLWQPVGFIRQVILEKSFSFLPLFDREAQGWKLVSDYEVARYLDVDGTSQEQRAALRKKRLSTTLEDAVAGKGGVSLGLIPTSHFLATDTKSSVLQACNGYPVVIVHEKDISLVLGIVTPFDLV